MRLIGSPPKLPRQASGSSKPSTPHRQQTTRSHGTIQSSISTSFHSIFRPSIPFYQPWHLVMLSIGSHCRWDTLTRLAQSNTAHVIPFTQGNCLLMLQNTNVTYVHFVQALQILPGHARREVLSTVWCTGTLLPLRTTEVSVQYVIHNRFTSPRLD